MIDLGKVSNLKGHKLLTEILGAPKYGKGKEIFQVNFYFQNVNSYTGEKFFTAVDNRTYDCWIEDFKNERLAKLWLEWGF